MLTFKHFQAGLVEQVEELEELSKDTLASYAKKSNAARSHEPDDMKADRRGTGVMNSLDKLAGKKSGPLKGKAAAANFSASKGTSTANKDKAAFEKAVDKKANESVEELEEVNHREFASKGLMHPEMSKHMKVGNSMDFYSHGTGDKISGTVTKNDGKQVHVKADKGGKVAAGSTHKFKVATSLDEDIDEASMGVDPISHKTFIKGGVPMSSSPKSTTDRRKANHDHFMKLASNAKTNADKEHYKSKAKDALVAESSTGNAFDWKSYTSAKKGQGVSGTTKTYHDVKKVSTGTVYTKQYDKDGTSKGSGDDAAKKAEPVEQPKRGRGRPKGVGAKAGGYKPRDPASKAASAAKAAASKAANRKAANEEFNQEFIEELMSMLVENQDVEEFMDLLQEEEFDEFYVSEIEAIEEACGKKHKKAPVTESTSVSKYANFLNK